MEENVNGVIRNGGSRQYGICDQCLSGCAYKAGGTAEQLATKTDVIMDGRDIGTCVLPDAQVKIYLTASSKRAQSADMMS